MRVALVLLVLASSGAPPPNPAPKATGTPKPTAAPTAGPAVARATPGEPQPADLSSFARKVKVDRSKANTLFRQDGPVPTPAPAVANSPSDPASSNLDSRRSTPEPSSEETTWRSRAESLRRNLADAQERKARTERNLPPAATSSEGTAQRETLLYHHQVEIDRAQAALDALAAECRQSPACQPGWIR